MRRIFILFLLLASVNLLAQNFKVKRPIEMSGNIVRSNYYLGSTVGLYSYFGVPNETVSYAYIDSITATCLTTSGINTTSFTSSTVTTDFMSLSSKFANLNILPGVGLSFIGAANNPYDNGYFDNLSGSKINTDSLIYSSYLYYIKPDYLLPKEMETDTTIGAFEKNTIPTRKISNYLSATTVSKKGVVIFRVDDAKDEDNYKLLNSRVFDKWGYPWCWSFNSGELKRGARSDEIARDFVRRGHLLMDHTPDHTTEFIAFTNASDTARFSGVEGVDSIVYIAAQNAYYVFLERVFPDTAGYKQNTTINHTSGTRVIARVSGDALPTGYGYVFIDGEWITPGRNYIVDYTDCTKREIDTDWTFTSTNNIDLYFVSTEDVQLSHAAFRVLLEESRRQWRALGLPMPKVWVQPGGFHPLISSDTLAEVGKEYGIIAGEVSENGTEHPSWSNIPMKYYHDQDYADFRLEDYTWASQKKGLVDALAKNKIVLTKGHLYITGVTGADDDEKYHNLAARFDSCMAFLSENNIPVIDYEEYAKLLSARTAAYANIIPPFNIDLDADGDPDGYDTVSGTLSSGDGQEEWGEYNINRSSSGEFFETSEIGSIESGFNTMMLFAKGSGTSDIKVTITMYARNGVYSDIDEHTFTPSASWAAESYDIDIPIGTSYINLLIETDSYSSGTLKIGYMNLSKKKW
jgi:hypothetical protein